MERELRELGDGRPRAGVVGINLARDGVPPRASRAWGQGVFLVADSWLRLEGATAREGAAQGDLVGELEIAAHGQAGG